MLILTYSRGKSNYALERTSLREGAQRGVSQLVDAAVEAHELINRIDAAFGTVEMPKGIDLSFHKDDCFECEYLRRELEELGEGASPESIVRAIYQDMSCLSSAAWKWCLPIYLKRSLLTEPSISDTETEFIIYNLSPNDEEKAETIERMSLLSDGQLHCLELFVEWCSEDPHWSSYCKSEIDQAKAFVGWVRNNAKVG